MTDIPPVWELRRSDPRYYRALRQTRIARGQCGHCSRPPVPGKTLCPVCAARTGAYQSRPKARQWHADYLKRIYAERKAEGLCVVCGKILTVFDGRRAITCNACRNLNAQRQKRRQNAIHAKRRATGICVRCGKVKVEAGRRNCAECRAKNAASAREGKRRRKARRQRQAVKLAS